MRYRENLPPNTDVPYGESMHDMLTLTMWLSIFIGLILHAAGRHGNIMWMKAWSVGLVFCSIAYLLGETLGLI